MTTTFETAKVGDRVWSVEYGWGVIRHTTYTQAAPILAMFTAVNCKFKLNGTRLDSENQTLFWDEIVIEAPAKPMPDLQVDAKVFVWDGNGEVKLKRHFSHFEGGELHAFTSGESSWTGRITAAYAYWELAE